MCEPKAQRTAWPEKVPALVGRVEHENDGAVKVSIDVGVRSPSRPYAGAGILY